MSDLSKYGIWCLVSLIICAGSGLYLFGGEDTSDAEAPIFAIITFLISFVSLFLSVCWLYAESDLAPNIYINPNTLAALQRQQMINKLNDIRNELNDD